MLRKLIKYTFALKVIKYIIILMFFSNLYAQFKDVTISFDDRLLRDDEKSALFNLNGVSRASRAN